MLPTAWDPDRYLACHGFIIQRGRALIDLLAPMPGERILDLGCGTGDLAKAIAERGAAVVGVDASAAMVEAARDRFPDQDFRLLDAAELPFHGEFDAVFSHAALHWVVRADEAAAGMARALVPGGRVVLEMGGHRNCEALESAFAEAMRRVTGRTYRSPWYFPTLPGYGALLESHGLTVRAGWYFELPTPLQGEEGLDHWLRQFLPGQLVGLDAVHAEAILEEARRILKPSLFRDGAWLADYRRLRIVAEATG